MKPKLSFLYLLLSASAATILPVVSEDVAKSVPKTEAQLLQEKQQACYVAINTQILRHINPEVSQANRFSRVLVHRPEKYFDYKIFGENVEGSIEFEIMHINRIIEKPTQVVVATGRFNSKTGELLLKDDASGQYVVASEHPLLKKKTNT